MSAEAEVLLRALEKRNAHAAHLAMLASAAVQIEPELLRALRLLIPNADAGAEADVWLSDLVESRSALAITLRADVRQRLQEQLEERSATLDAIAGVLERMHANGSEVIWIEEQVTIESLRKEPGAKERIDKLLAPVVAALEQQQHRGLARWAIRAFDAAPALAKETQSMWRLMRSSSVTRAATAGATSPTMPMEAALEELPRRLVRLRLRKDSLEIEAVRRGRVVVGGSFDSAVWRETIFARLHALGFEVVIPEKEIAPGTSISDAVRKLIDTSDGYIASGGPSGWTESERRYAAARNLPVLDIVDDAGLGARVASWAVKLRKSMLSEAPGEDIEIPDTVPLMLEVAWDEEGRRSRRVTMQPGETAHVPLRPRDVTVAAFNGEMYAIEPELALDDYAIVVGIEQYEDSGLVISGAEYSGRLFSEWLVSGNGGRLPEENVRQVRTAEEFSRALEQPDHRVRRIYAYLAGAAPFDNLLQLSRGAIDLLTLRRDLRSRAEEILLIVESAWVDTPKFAGPEPISGTRELILANDVRQGALLPPLLEAFSGAVSSPSGTVTAFDVLQHVREARPELFWSTSSGDFVLLRNIFTTASLHFPRAMFGARLQLTPSSGEPISTQIADSVELIVRPVRYSLAIPEHDYYRTVRFRPGRNDISLRWHFNGKWVIVAGSSANLDRDQKLICEAVARSLADHGFGLFVGAYQGVDEIAAHTFVERVDFLGGNAVEVFRQYLQESMTPRFEVARPVVVQDAFDAPLSEASAMIVIGGADGMAAYANRARKRQVPVFPIAATGGAAAELARESPGELSIDSVSANDIALKLVERIERVLSTNGV